MAVEEAASSINIKQLHVVVLPFPLLGHINPMLQLALRLASIQCAENVRVRVTFACAKKYLESFRKSWEESDILKKDLEPSTISIQGIPDDFMPASNMSATAEILEGSVKLKDNFVSTLRECIISDGHGLSCIVSDSLFSGWIQDVAADFGVPWICYFSLTASNLIAADSVPDLFGQGVLCVDSTGVNIIPTDSAQVIEIPGLTPLSSSEMLILPLSVVNDPYHIPQRREASWLILNTVDALEQQEIQYLREQLGYNVLPVGPLQPVHLLKDTMMKQELNHQSPANYTKLSETETDPKIGISSNSVLNANSMMPDEFNSCLSWLDKTQSPALFVSFGSFVNLSMETLNKLLLALLESEVCFLWVIRKELVPDMTDEKWDEFSGLEMSTGRGLVVKWAPQLKVLRHPAVGAFLTHCGWNSTLESICAGIPMLAWPVYGDQPLNAKYIVDIWKLGLRISPEIDMVSVIKEIFTNDIYKIRAVEFGLQCRAALRQSESNLVSILESLPSADNDC